MRFALCYFRRNVIGSTAHSHSFIICGRKPSGQTIIRDFLKIIHREDDTLTLPSLASLWEVSCSALNLCEQYFENEDIEPLQQVDWGNSYLRSRNKFLPKKLSSFHLRKLFQVSQIFVNFSFFTQFQNKVTTLFLLHFCFSFFLHWMVIFEIFVEFQDRWVFETDMNFNLGPCSFYIICCPQPVFIQLEELIYPFSVHAFVLSLSLLIFLLPFLSLQRHFQIHLFRVTTKFDNLELFPKNSSQACSQKEFKKSIRKYRGCNNPFPIWFKFWRLQKKKKCGRKCLDNIIEIYRFEKNTTKNNLIFPWIFMSYSWHAASSVDKDSTSCGVWLERIFVTTNKYRRKKYRMVGLYWGDTWP